MYRRWRSGTRKVVYRLDLLVYGVLEQHWSVKISVCFTWMFNVPSFPNRSIVGAILFDDGGTVLATRILTSFCLSAVVIVGIWYICCSGCLEDTSHKVVRL
jgi:hypothetical protein